ncbi:hypothetical protein [Schlesneria paludicola]|uniref:hypothetical protein n=1 Tax=Schlesneria paludicola TaxID=360056 RepID=UPI00029B236A|nr:hypothetical protein [Schlesneria paludicola]
MAGDWHTARHRVGVAFLALACISLCVWARSRTFSDGVEFHGGDHTRIYLESENGFLLLTRIREQASHERFFPRWTTMLSPGLEVANHQYHDDCVTWRLGIFALGSHEFPKIGKDADEIKLWLVSYMCIVVPSMILSAWLLLGRRMPWNRRISVKPADSSSASEPASA